MVCQRGGLTRREFFQSAAGGTALAASGGGDLIVPVHQILDSSVQWNQERLRWFRSRLWPEAEGDLLKCGIRLQTTSSDGDIWRPAWREPVVRGLQHGVINFVITGRIPILWDRGLGLSGVSMRYRGHHMSMIAMSRAHLHEFPFISVNSCVHELLHVLLGDIFESDPGGVHRELRELRVDALATRLWLFGAGGAIRESASACLARLRSEGGTTTASC